MKSFTIHKIEGDLEERLTKLAQKSGLSLNQLVKNLLRESLGLKSVAEVDDSGFSEFCGQWSGQETDEFNQAVSCTTNVDEEIWK